MCSRIEDGEQIEVSSCEDLNTLTFANISNEEDDPDSVFILNRPFDCGNGVDSLLLYAANYVVDQDAQGVFENGVVFTDEVLSDINRMEITELTSEYLSVEYVQDGKRVQESYVQYP
ncbi:hypothetical protein [Reichenbachiella ulvae]|uniref:Uncharacterized protein n=1 Tax=Reichenbachiella ulvae TaxID=2980104 RepID=A0ABT3CUE5_9BACT|nr:hypothetical protein [Reichenbachiella ulvae]MCV9387217.1 hypothetical protein [Reichenbachiella ulvae]